MHDIVSKNTKQQSHVRIQRRGSRRLPVYEDLTYSDTNGLTISFSRNHTADLTERARKERHVADTNEACKIAGVKKQSIMIALANSPLLWEFDGQPRR